MCLTDILGSRQTRGIFHSTQNSGLRLTLWNKSIFDLRVMVNRNNRMPFMELNAILAWSGTWAKRSRLQIEHDISKISVYPLSGQAQMVVPNFRKCFPEIDVFYLISNQNFRNLCQMDFKRSGSTRIIGLVRAHVIRPLGSIIQDWFVDYKMTYSTCILSFNCCAHVKKLYLVLLPHFQRLASRSVTEGTLRNFRQRRLPVFPFLVCITH